MYIFPGYTEFYEQDNILFVSSKLFQNTIKITDAKLQDEFYSILRCGGCSSLDTPLTQFLHEQELLATRPEIDNVLKQVKELLDKTLILTIMPTEGCNFRCPYCYEDHLPITMRRKIMDQINLYIAEQSQHFDSIHIAWFGGEPTLCKDTILETSAYIQALQNTNHFQYHANMTTNGYLLDATLFQQFYQVGITSYQITLDGWHHDKTRPHVSGKGTLKAILANLTAISALPKETYDFRIILRHNILAGDEDFSWYDHLYALFGQDDRFSVLIHSVDDWGGSSVHTLDVLQDGSKQALLAKHILYLDKIGFKCQNHQNQPFSQICYACYPHSMVFRASGKIEKCTVCQDHPKNHLGYIDLEKGVVLDPAVNDLWTFSNLKPACYTCPDLLKCLNMKCRKSAVLNGQETNYDCCNGPASNSHSA